MAEFMTELLEKRRNRISTSSVNSTSSPNNKKSPKIYPDRNLVPRAFPLKNGWGTTHFLREKPWGRGCPDRRRNTGAPIENIVQNRFKNIALWNVFYYLNGYRHIFIPFYPLGDLFRVKIR